MVTKKPQRKRTRPPGKFTSWDGKTQTAAKGYQRVTFYAPEDAVTKLKAVAILRKLTMSELLGQIIERHLKGVRVEI